MKNSFKLFAATLALVGFANVASAQNGNTASATGTAIARIIEPISLSATDGQLRFGNIISDADGGTVTVSGVSGYNAGSVSYDGLVSLSNGWNSAVLTSTQSTSTGNFSVSGEPGFHYLIDMPSQITMTSGESNTMTCDLFNPFHDVLNENIIDNVGYAKFGVGGRLYVGENQPNGVYTAEFTCTVYYE
jgi:hypothetical protein